MEAIRELQRRLQAAQAVSNARKISERNCIDLLQKLIATDQVKLFHTTSGKEWLTPEQLDREIRDALAANGGRLSVTELPGELGVGVEHCEARADLICRRDGAISRMHGELLSTQYVQGVAQEIEESLAEAGCIAVSDLATRYNLPAEFVRESVFGKVATSHVVKQNSIYTSTHAARVEARLRGALRGCTQPVALSQLASRHNIADVDMVATIAQRQIRDGFVMGRLHGSMFTPTVYADAQASRVDDFFNANQYLTFALAKSAGVVVKDWSQSKGVDGMTLCSAFVASPVVDSAMASISEAMSSESWLDAYPILPPALTVADAVELLQQLSNRKTLPQNAVVLDRAVMSRQFLKSIAASMDADAKAAAERLLKAPAAKAKGKKAAAAIDAEDDDFDASAGKKKSKRGVAKGKKGRVDDEDGPATNVGSGGCDSAIDNSVIEGVLAEQFPDVPTELYDEVFAQVQPLLGAMVAEEQASMQATLQTKRKSQFEASEKLVQDRYEQLALGLRALEAKGLQESPLQQHLLREAVTEPLHALLALRWEELSGETIEVTAASRKQVLDKIVAKEGANKAECLSRLFAMFSGKAPKETKDQKDSKDPARSDKGSKEKDKSEKATKGRRKKYDDEDDADDRNATADVGELYHAAADDCHIFCRKVDKKREKEALKEQRASYRERLRLVPAADLAQVCCLGLHLAVLQDGISGLSFPTEVWAMRLVASCIDSEALREEASGLIDAIEARAAAAEDDQPSDLVALEVAAKAWQDKALAFGK